jgi:hypothetical protein
MNRKLKQSHQHYSKNVCSIQTYSKSFYKTIRIFTFSTNPNKN